MVPVGQDCVSPPRHSAFSDVAGLIAFVERIAHATGLPVGIKSAVGEMSLWEELASRMASSGEGPDFVNVDGGEGGTRSSRAAPRRAANYLIALRAEMLSLARSCGAPHPALVGPGHVEIVSERFGSAPLDEVFGYRADWPVMSASRRAEIEAATEAQALSSS